jgi:murein DD-endopeptidase MepM/ murein hydrolase activator NlpD
MDLLVSALAAAVMASMSGVSNLTSNSNSPVPPQNPTSTVEPAPKVVTENKQEKLNDIFIVPVSDDCEYFQSRGSSSTHVGVDIARKHADENCTVVAAAEGKVTFAGWSDDGSGYKVVVKHSDGYVSEYHHGNGEFFVKNGEKVSQGTRLMTMGCTGLCTGTHLHFEVSLNGVLVNPGKLQ